ncbi:MAG TPA: lipoyl synthase [Armatimonadota bacterium]|jgi:lipoic acid synthetase
MSNTDDQANPERPLRLPDWLRVKIGKRDQSAATHALLEELGLNTVCSSARCPNRGECYSCSTATFLILGNHCTRDCRFCAVPHGDPEPPAADEPERVALAAERLGLRYVVLTSVTRDDLPDGGARHFAACIGAIRERLPEAAVEVLTPDFQGDVAALDIVLQAGPTVFNHNVETVPRLQAAVRSRADWDTSLGLLAAAGERAPGIPRKSGLMVGLGEADAEVRETLAALHHAGVSIVTIGQYLRPTTRHLPVQRYVTPERMQEYEQWGRDLGLRYVASSPFVRSSYHAAEAARAVT